MGVFAGLVVAKSVFADEDAVECEDVFGLGSFVVFGLGDSVVGVVRCENAGLGGGSRSWDRLGSLIGARSGN